MSNELTKEAELVLKYTGILDRDTIMTYDIQVELFNLINEVQAIPQSTPSPKGTEEIAEKYLESIMVAFHTLSFPRPSIESILKKAIQEALQSKQGWTDEDMANAFYNGIWCNANPKMGFPEWLQQYKKDKMKK